MTSSTTMRPATGPGAPDDVWTADHQDAAGSENPAEVTTVISESGLDDDPSDQTTVVSQSGLDDDPSDQTTVVSQSGLDDDPSELTTVVSQSGLDDEAESHDDGSASPAVAWREGDTSDDADEHRRGIRVAGYTVRPWQLAVTGAAVFVLVAVAAILGSAGGNDGRAPTPQPAVSQPPADLGADDTANADTVPHSDDARLSHANPADRPPVDPAHDPALSDPPTTDPALNAARPPAVPAPSALPQGPLPPNQLPGGPPLPYNPGSAPANARPYDPAFNDPAFNNPAFNPSQSRQPGYSAEGAPSTPAARGYQPRPYDRDRYHPRRGDRGTISHRLGMVTGLSRDSDGDDRDYYRSNDRYRDYPGDSYSGRDSYSQDRGYDRDERGPYSRRYNRRYDRDSDEGLTGALGGL